MRYITEDHFWVSLLHRIRFPSSTEKMSAPEVAKIPPKRGQKRKCDDVSRELGGELDNIVQDTPVAEKPKSSKRQKSDPIKTEASAESTIRMTIEKYFLEIAEERKQPRSTIGGLCIIGIINSAMFPRICESFVKTAMQSVFEPELDRLEKEGGKDALSQEALERIRFTDSFRFLIVYILAVLMMNIAEHQAKQAKDAEAMPVPEVTSHHHRYQNVDMLKKFIAKIVTNKVVISYQKDDVPEKATAACVLCNIHLRTGTKYHMLMDGEKFPICVNTMRVLQSITYLFTAIPATFKQFKSIVETKPEAGPTLKSNLAKITDGVVTRMRTEIANICMELAPYMITNVPSKCVRRYMQRFFVIYEDPDDYRNNIDNISTE